ncbi:GNAT family N-acetyltransferase [Emticicia sp. C21]|uniref:GNAT family N-acetyltransferase n=1 Tax=Emticicia sp. C21 TaxID=2302915 RepID=UPI000E3539F0|nr:GNAT family N-acetyltransferase [Emticicia sp. C21]RFS17430.1 N-acetyltransferase [Emticicia sp. C21]
MKGDLITLRPSIPQDRRQIFEWLAHSDLTSAMLGPPNFPENPVPTWEEYIDDYYEYFFDGSQPESGRCFIIQLGDTAIGQVNYNNIYEEASGLRFTELDIWMAGSEYTHKGYGTDALKTLCHFLHKDLGCQKFIIAPARQNIGAVKAYQKAGFVETTAAPPNFVPDYADTIIMVKYIRD